MTFILITIFCFSSLVVIYVYAGYPFLLSILSFLFNKPIKKGDFIPKVSLIIAAYNEEKIIKEKIENSLRLDYPKDKLQIIVASDGSTDRTNQIASEYEKQGVILHIQKVRTGKTMTLNNAVEKSEGEILVFTDATAMLGKECMRTLMQNFNDANVGCVSPSMTYKNIAYNDITRIEGLYWRYESFLKQKESDLGSLAFVPGACFAIRKNLHRPVRNEYDHDCISPLDVIMQGYRVIYDKSACFYETTVSSSLDLFNSKVRMITKDFAGTLSRRKLFNPFKYHLIILTLISHKLLRWLIPFFLIIIFISNICLMHIPLFQILLIGQALYYLVAVIGLINNYQKGFLSIPFYFCIVNLAALLGISKAMIGKKIQMWQPIR